MIRLILFIALLALPMVSYAQDEQPVGGEEISLPEAEDTPEVCATLSQYLEEERLDELVITESILDLNGDGVMEELIPVARNEDDLVRSYDIVSGGDSEQIAGFGLQDALSILFLRIDEQVYVWTETKPNISALRRFDEKIDNIWNTDLICRFEREEK